MRPNKLRSLLKANKPSIATHVHSVWPSVIEAVGHTAMYDYVEFVAEYAPYDLHDLDHLCRAGEIHDLGMMIKIDAESRGFFAQRAIGSGFQSVLFADCKLPDEFRECVRLCRADTPGTDGSYGVATRRFSYMGYGGGTDYVKALDDIVVAVMIEKKAAVENLEEILDIEGIDMIQWGPADYSVNTGKAGRMGDPAVKEAERNVIKMALKAGVQPRAEIGSPDQAKYYLDLGVQHFNIGTDITILHQWWQSNGDELRKAVEGG